MSVVVPVYNSASTLPTLVERIECVLTIVSPSFEIVLVDDASHDASWAVVRELAGTNPRVRGIHLARNSGQHNAVLAGLRAARGDVIVTLDDDLQHPPEEIPSLLGGLADGVDLVYGTPRRETHGWYRDAGSRIAKHGLRLLGWADATEVSDFRALRREVSDALAEVHGPGVSLDGALTWVTANVRHVPVEHQPREEGRSNYRLGSLVDYATAMATAHGAAPLRMVAFAGAGMASAGALRRARGRASGTALVLGGVQLVATGIVGEYVGRILPRVSGRPTYVIRDAVDARDPIVAAPLDRTV